MGFSTSGGFHTGGSGGGGSGGSSSGGVIQVNTYADLPVTGKTDILYITKDKSKAYYWNNTSNKYDELESVVRVLTGQQDIKTFTSTGLYISGENTPLTGAPTTSGNWIVDVQNVNGYTKQWFSSPNDTWWTWSSDINGNFDDSSWSRLATNGDIEYYLADGTTTPTFKQLVLNGYANNYIMFKSGDFSLGVRLPFPLENDCNVYLPNTNSTTVQFLMGLTANQFVQYIDAQGVQHLANSINTNVVSLNNNALTVTINGIESNGVNVQALIENPVENVLLATDPAGKLKQTGATISTDSTSNVDSLILTSKATQSAINSRVTSAKSFRGGYNASTNVYPTTGGSGTGNTILAGDTWQITVNGTLGGLPVIAGKNCILALVDNPTTDAHWFISEEYQFASETQSGIMSGEDFLKLLWLTSAVEVTDADINVNNQFQIQRYYINMYVYTTSKTPDILLPDFLNNPNKSSYLYDRDTINISNNGASVNVINVKCLQTVGGTPIQILDPSAGNLTQLTMQPNTKVTFMWSDNNPDPNNRTNPVQWKIID
jgi:hypothetical protein